MSGRLIVIEGTDGSGKATQTAALARSLEAAGKEVRTLSFPCYDSDSSALVRMYLHGEFGSRPDDVNCYAASAFYAVDRYASCQQDWGSDYRAGKILLADRYTTSNAVYQMAKLPKTDWEEYRAWLADFEYTRLGIPRPDLVLYLDVRPEISAALMTGRYAGDESKKDIHEKNLDYQMRSRQAAIYCAEKEGWKRIKCDESGSMRPVDAIAADILKTVLEVF